MNFKLICKNGHPRASQCPWLSRAVCRWEAVCRWQVAGGVRVMGGVSHAGWAVIAAALSLWSMAVLAVAAGGR